MAVPERAWKEARARIARESSRSATTLGDDVELVRETHGRATSASRGRHRANNAIARAETLGRRNATRLLSRQSYVAHVAPFSTRLLFRECIPARPLQNTGAKQMAGKRKAENASETEGWEAQERTAEGWVR